MVFMPLFVGEFGLAAVLCGFILLFGPRRRPDLGVILLFGGLLVFTIAVILLVGNIGG